MGTPRHGYAGFMARGGKRANAGREPIESWLAVYFAVEATRHSELVERAIADHEAARTAGPHCVTRSAGNGRPVAGHDDHSSWGHNRRHLRSAYRASIAIDNRYSSFGFRSGGRLLLSSLHLGSRAKSCSFVCLIPRMDSFTEQAGAVIALSHTGTTVSVSVGHLEQ